MKMNSLNLGNDKYYLNLYFTDKEDLVEILKRLEEFKDKL